MASSGVFTRESDQRYSVSGHLGFTSVRDVLRASAPLLDGQPTIEIDLAKVESADSAGLALLIEWYCLAQRSNRSIRFVNAPAQLRALAKISDIETVLPLD
jgi:phospholipid transport system transporter-binding protein